MCVARQIERDYVTALRANGLCSYCVTQFTFPVDSEPDAAAKLSDGRQATAAARDDAAKDRLASSLMLDSLNVELVKRCQTHDKNKYTIAFDGEPNADTTLPPRHPTLDMQEDIFGAKKPADNGNEAATQLPLPKESKSMPNIVQIAANLQNNNNSRRHLPLYDLSGSHSSHTPSSDSPRSAQPPVNRLDLSSSGPMSTSSYTEDSDPDQYQYLQRRETNNNNHHPIMNAIARREFCGGDDMAYEEICSGLGGLVVPRRLKQASSPIKEEDEPLSDSSRADVNMTSASDDPRPFARPRASLQHPARFRPAANEANNSPNARLTQHEWMRRGHATTARGHHSSARSAATQVPVYIQHKEVQTKRDDATQRQLYVCYPNYSLPDLSFLTALQSSSGESTPRVILSPTKPPAAAPTRPGAAHRPAKSRPHSLNDFETLARQSFKHIRDWDSLNVLLPSEFKELMQRIQRGHQAEATSSDRSTITDEHSNVRMRPRPTSRPLSSSKRFSLQEQYMAATPATPGQRSGQATPTGAPPTGRFMTRSETMPCWPPCNWAAPPCAHHCHHHHHCCAMMSPCMTPSLNSSRTNPSSIDQLCELLSMDSTLQEVTSLLNKAGSPLTPDSNFRVLKQHWQTLAESLTEKKKETPKTAPPTRQPPPPPTKAKDSTDKGSKGPKAASTSKPAVPAKSNAVLRARNGPRPARPASLHAPSGAAATFKSMIPVAKPLKTPPGGKPSPTTTTTAPKKRT